jgi:hypothetical protein
MYIIKTVFFAAIIAAAYAQFPGMPSGMPVEAPAMPSMPVETPAGMPAMPGAEAPSEGSEGATGGSRGRPMSRRH